MINPRIFDLPHLNWATGWAIDRNCRVEGRFDSTYKITANPPLHEIPGITVLVDPEILRALSRNLQVRTSLDGSTGAKPLAELLATVAIMASRAGPTVSGPPPRSTQLGILERDICTDFALACTLSLARSRKYPIPANRIPWDELYSALMLRDNDALVRLFYESLRMTQLACEPRQTTRRPESIGRTLSAESYWNLFSVAEDENWGEPVILRLIEEYLSPPPHPHFAYYSNTVSGDEWVKLHICLYGFYESILWDPRDRSSRKLFTPPLVVHGSLQWIWAASLRTSG
jgi:hypothetical protein